MIGHFSEFLYKLQCRNAREYENKFLLIRIHKSLLRHVNMEFSFWNGEEFKI